jgi:hypothetical protein
MKKSLGRLSMGMQIRNYLMQPRVNKSEILTDPGQVEVKILPKKKYIKQMKMAGIKVLFTTEKTKIFLSNFLIEVLNKEAVSEVKNSSTIIIGRVSKMK